MYKEIIEVLKQKGCNINNLIKTQVEQLCDVLNSASEQKGDISEVLNWLEQKRVDCRVVTKEIGINDLDKWRVNPSTGNISHESGKFFSVIGVKVEKAKGREVNSWTQPMVNQHECGILGILCKKINGVRHYLLYAKYEPGNTHKIQISPTLQATESNLKLAHGGKKPLFAEYFEGGGKGKVLCSVVSVEDGGRFYLKTNRNMIVEIDKNEDINIPDNFIWLTLSQIKKLLKRDNLVNSLVRSIFGSWH